MLTETGGFQEKPHAALGPLADLARRFQVRERLDHGRLGAVYRALDKHRQNGWGEPTEVALLIVPADIVQDRERLHAFGRVFEAVQRLRHRHIAAAYDFAREGSTYFMTMELVDGESLRSVMDSLQPELISQQEALSVVRAVGEALLYAHDAGVVHGDVRAENVLVAPRRQVKVLFSAACLSGTGPFQAARRDDAWGLAALAYELLSGTKPPSQTLLSHGGRAADEALPAVKGLSRRGWKALRAALAGRDDRGRGVGALLQGLSLTTGGRRAPSRASDWSEAAGRLLRRAAVAGVLMAGIVLAARGVLRFGPDRVTETAVAWFRAAEDAVREYAITPAEGFVERLRAEASTDQASKQHPPSAVQEQPRLQEPPSAGAGAKREPPPAEAASKHEPSSARAGALQEPPPARVHAKTPAPAPSKEQPVPQTKAAAGAGSAAAQTLSFAEERIVVSEDRTVAVVKIQRSNPDGVLRFVLWTSDGTAVAGDDYGDIGRVVDSFRDGEVSRTIFIPITNDSVPEPRESFYVHMSRLAPDGRQQGPLRTAEIVIVDDD